MRGGPAPAQPIAEHQTRRRSPGLAGGGRPQPLIEPDPQRRPQLLADDAAQWSRVLQPLLQQAHRLPREGQALRTRAALDVVEQDRGLTSPVDVGYPEVGDAVGDDAGVGAEQQHVGERDVGGREQRPGHPTEVRLGHRVARHPGPPDHLRATERAVPQQQPGQVLIAQPAPAWIHAVLGRPQQDLLRGVRVRDDALAAVDQGGPFSLGVGSERLVGGLRLQRPTVQMGTHLRVEMLGRGVISGQQNARVRLPKRANRHPVADQDGAGQVGRASGEAGRRQFPHHAAQRTDVIPRRRACPDPAQRMSQHRQALGEILSQLRVRQPVQASGPGGAVRELEPHRQRLRCHNGRHQTSASQANSASTSAAIPAGTSPACCPACS